MKILFVITKSNWGGAQKYVYELARTLREDEAYDIAVAFGGHGQLADKLKEIGVRTHTLHTLENNFSLSSLWRSGRELISVIRQERPDIVHLNSSKIGLLGAFCGKYFSASKIVFTSHGWPFNEERMLPVRLLLRFSMALTCLFSDAIIAVSKKIEEETPLRPLFRNKIKQIYFGIPTYSMLDRKEARGALLIDGTPDRIEIVTTAELHPNKGYHYALSAMRNLVFNDKLNLHYHIIGEGKDREKIESLIRKYHIEAYVTLHGFVQDAAKYMKAFDIFLLTSTTEALGFVTLEAGNAGLPVVATRVGGVPEVIQHGKTGLLADSKDTKGIKENLKKLIVDAGLREKLAQALHERIQHTFTLATTIEETKSLYEKI